MERNLKIAYLILAHRNPKLIKKMVEFLSSEDCAFFIHVDKKSNIDEFSLTKDKNIFFSDKRIPVYWAEYSIVEAILNLIQQAVDAPQNYDYYVLLSGSDYPLRSKEYIHNFFDKNRGEEFISLINIGNEEGETPFNPCSEYIARKYCSYLNSLRIPSSRPVSRYVLKMLSRLGFVQRDYRKHLGSLEPYVGSMWWSLTREACRYILDFVKTHRAICGYYENTFVPDEMFFHTILGNSIFKTRIHKSLMYVDWSGQAEHSWSRQARDIFLERGSHISGHPDSISEKHVSFFEKDEKVIIDDLYGSGEMLFARKFSDDRLDLIQRIENMIERKEKQVNCPY